jgi:hypothetical protein
MKRLMLTDKQLKLAQRLVNRDDFTDDDAANAQMLLSLLLSERKDLINERDDWKRRAAAHGCDINSGDDDCG